jgi:hypothetical protein
MAEAGGSSTISGVGYEQWAFAYFMAKALLDDSDIISMSSQKNRALPKTNDGEIGLNRQKLGCNLLNTLLSLTLKQLKGYE